MATLSRRSSEVPRILDRSCIFKEGYLIKSPPDCDGKIIKKRWRMRWFVLYDTRERVENDPSLEREVELIYYKSEEKLKQRLPPKGKISLIDTVVYKHKGILHGYPHIINVQTYNRLYHICATQLEVHKEWMEKILQHYVPKGEKRQTIAPCLSSAEDPLRSTLHPDDATTQTALTETTCKRLSNVSITDILNRHPSIKSEKSCSSVDGDYTYNPSGFTSMSCSCDALAQCLCDPPLPLKAFTLGKWITKEKSASKKPCPLPPGEGDQKIPRHTSYVTMKGYYRSVTGGRPESEDEGIGRTDSEASSISSTSTSTSTSSSTVHSYTSSNDAWKAKRDSLLSGLISTRLASTGSCTDSLLGGFVGPRLSSSGSGGKTTTRMARAKSLGDLTLDGESTKEFEESF